MEQCGFRKAKGMILIMITNENNKLIREFAGEILQIEAWGINSLRIRATKEAEFSGENNALLAPISANPQIIMNKAYAEIKNGSISAQISNNGGRITIFNGDTVILEEYARNFDDPDHIPSPLKHYPREWRGISGGSYSLRVRFESDPNEKIFGMGQYQQENFDLKGSYLELAHRNTQSSVPFYLSDKGYGFLWNNPAVGKVIFGKNITEWNASATKELDYFITVGETPAQILENYTENTGRSPMMPDYAMGFWQSKLRYQTQDELLSVAREYKKIGVPLSVIVLDFCHWVHQGDWDFDRELFPDPTAMIKELSELGVKLMVSMWPTVSYDSENYKKMHENGMLVNADRGTQTTLEFCENTRFIDPTNPKTREFVWQRLKKKYYDLGVSLFWLDEAEPEFSVYDFDNFRYRIGTVSEKGNLYPFYYSKMIYDGLRNENEENPLHLVRCAWAGSQRFGSLVWSGDVSTTFKALREQIVCGLSMGIAGFPWWTSDIGGFIGGNPDDPDYRELVIRWFQFGAFSPVFRIHGDRNPKIDPVLDRVLYSGAKNEIWSYGDEAYGIFKKYIKIREDMKPYIKDIMKEAATNGSPVMRPMFYEFPKDEICYTLNDQYMFGPEYLVAPVLNAGQREINIYLPKGASWKNTDNGMVYEGGQTITIPAPLDTICVLKKA